MRNHSAEYELERDRDLEIFYLIRSSAYFDYFNDERFERYPVY